MRIKAFTRAAIAVGALAVFPACHVGMVGAQQREELPAAPIEAADSQAEAMLQGPIHEAFAKPVSAGAEAGMVAPEQPPAPVEELPPEVKPEGDEVVWIPGYWAWNPVDQEFLWVSGVWRLPPPDMRWVPGYWTEATDGWQWVSGFWTPIEVAQIEYLPAPPETLERGPTSPSPSETHYWVMGCWIFTDGAYAWRPGYWTPYHEGWVWAPAYYVETPRGFVFCDGHWDYSLAHRGQLFAPVVFHQAAYQRPVIRYTPRVVIDVAHILMHMFVNPGHRHYYYGDFYDNRYRDVGYHAWSNYYRAPQHYDPIFTYYRSYYRVRGVDYVQRVHGWQTYFQRHEEYRPPRTFRDQTAWAARMQGNESARFSVLGRSLRDLAASPEMQTRFENVGEDRRRTYVQTATEFRNLSRDRIQFEARAASKRGAEGGSLDGKRGRMSDGFQLPDAPQFTASNRGNREGRADREPRDKDFRDDRRRGEGPHADVRENAPPPRPDAARRDVTTPPPGESREEAGRPQTRDRRGGEADRTPRSEFPARGKERPQRPERPAEDIELPPQPNALPEDAASPPLSDTPRPQRPGVRPEQAGRPQQPGVAREQPAPAPDQADRTLPRPSSPADPNRPAPSGNRPEERARPQTRPQFRPDQGRQPSQIGEPDVSSVPGVRPRDARQPEARVPGFPPGNARQPGTSPDATGNRFEQRRPSDRGAPNSFEERRYRPESRMTPNAREPLPTQSSSPSFRSPNDRGRSQGDRSLGAQPDFAPRGRSTPNASPFNQPGVQPQRPGSQRSSQPQATPSERRAPRFEAPRFEAPARNPQAERSQGRSRDAAQTPRGRSESRNRENNSRRDRD